MYRALVVPLLLLMLLAPAEPLAARDSCLCLTITDLESYEQMRAEFGRFAELLSGFIGCNVDFVPLRSRTAAVQALQRRRVDLVLTGPAEYVVFRRLTQAAPLVAFSRPDYHSALIALADGGPATVADLRGGTVVFGDVGSTSNHLAPMQLIADHGLNPLQDIVSFHVKRSNRSQAWEWLKKGEVKAIGMNYARLLELRRADREMEPGAFRILARSPDLPNDVLLAGRHLDPAMVQRLRNALLEHEAPLVAAILTGRDNAKYQGMKFLTRVKDSDYDSIRKMYITIGYPRFSSFLDEPPPGASPDAKRR